MACARNALRLSAILALIVALTTCGLGVRADAAIGEALRAELAKLQPDDGVGVIIRFAGSADLEPLKGMTPEQRRAALPRLLRDHAEAVQASVQSYLESLGVTRIRTLWINNAMAAVVPAAVVTDLAARAEVRRIDLDATVKLPRAVNGRR